MSIDTESAIKARRRRIAELYGSGLTVQAIADEVGIAERNVFNHLRKLSQNIAREMYERRWEAKGRQTLLLDGLRRKNMAAYELSQQNQSPTKTKAKRKTEANPQTPGKPAFLIEARRCVEAVSRLWGLDEPIQVETVTADKHDLFGAALDRLSIEEARCVLGFIREVKQLRQERESSIALSNGNGHANGNGNGEVIDVEVDGGD